MTARNWQTINAAYFGLLGIMYLVAPLTFLPIFYTAEVGSISPYVARLAGALGIALFAIAWSIRGTTGLTVRRTVLAALLFLDLVSLALTVAGILAGVAPALLWLAAAVFILVLAAGAAYFLYRTRSVSAEG